MKRLQRRSLKLNIRHSILLTAFIGTFLVAIISYALVSNQQWNALKTEADNALERTRIFANGEIMAYLNNSIALASNPDLTNILNKEYPTSIQTRMHTVNEISKFFAVIDATSFPNGGSFVIYTDNNTLYNNKYILDINKIPDDSIIENTESLPFSEVFWHNENKTHFVFYRRIDTSLSRNILRVEIPFKSIDDYMKSMGTPQYTLSCNKKSSHSSGYTNSTLLLNSYDLSVCIPLSVKRNVFLFNFLIAFGGFLTLSIILLIVTNTLTIRMTKDVHAFIEFIAKDSTLLNPSDVTVTDYEEFTLIKQRIIRLLNDQCLLHSQLRESEARIKEVELELLQSRFNPHLLYNTLSVVKWNILRGLSENSAEALDVLSDYYRKILNQDAIEISLEQEASLLRQYVRIMEFAQSESYTFETQIDPSLLNFTIVKHSLQPLVENAILHGLSQREHRVIRLTAQRENDVVLISIQDNGRGISPERLTEIRSEQYTSVYKSYGLKNTINSFKTHFGEEHFRFSIESATNEGTTIKLKIFKNMHSKS